MEKTIDGYLFGSDKDAQLAKQESEKILFLENRINYDDPKNVLAIYEKAIESRVFQTPVGIGYLKKLQKFLKEHFGSDEIRDIPMYLIYSKVDEGRPVKRRVVPSKHPQYKRKFAVSLLINMLLVALVIFMFVITLTGKNPNIINYENKLINKYSAWEQELSEREQVIREKERELNIQE